MVVDKELKLKRSRTFDNVAEEPETSSSSESASIDRDAAGPVAATVAEAGAAAPVDGPSKRTLGVARTKSGLGRAVDAEETGMKFVRKKTAEGLDVVMVDDEDDAKPDAKPDGAKPFAKPDGQTDAKAVPPGFRRKQTFEGKEILELMDEEDLLEEEKERKKQEKAKLLAKQQSSGRELGELIPAKGILLTQRSGSGPVSGLLAEGQSSENLSKKRTSFAKGSFKVSSKGSLSKDSLGGSSGGHSPKAAPVSPRTGLMSPPPEKEDLLPEDEQLLSGGPALAKDKDEDAVPFTGPTGAPAPADDDESSDDDPFAHLVREQTRRSISGAKEALPFGYNPENAWDGARWKSKAKAGFMRLRPSAPGDLDLDTPSSADGLSDRDRSGTGSATGAAEPAEKSKNGAPLAGTATGGAGTEDDEFGKNAPKNRQMKARSVSFEGMKKLSSTQEEEEGRKNSPDGDLEGSSPVFSPKVLCESHLHASFHVSPHASLTYLVCISPLILCFVSV